MASPKVSLPADKKAALTAMLQNMPTSGGKDEVHGNLINTTQGKLVLCDTKNWIGNANFSAVAEGDTIDISSVLPIKVGVIYGGFNQNDDECKWLFAFSAPGGDDSPKVYVEAGEMKDVDWDAVETLLDDSNSEIYYRDSSGCSAYGLIVTTSCTKFVCNFGDGG